MPERDVTYLLYTFSYADEDEEAGAKKSQGRIGNGAPCFALIAQFRSS